MASRLASSLLLLSGLSMAATIQPRQVVTPDNTCGGANGYTCNPNDTFGGACCSSSGWCGNSAAYCGTGCQTAFSTPGSCAGSAPAWQYHKEWTFTNGFPSDLRKSTWLVPEPPNSRGIDHKFEENLAVVRNGYLELIVPGGQSRAGPLLGAEVGTKFFYKYGSVKTTAIFGAAPGSCNGIFLYANGENESDIEWLSDPASQSNNGKLWVHFTNQDEFGDRPAGNTYIRVNPPANPTTTEHEYRIDWFADRVDYYIDGVLYNRTTTDIPREPAQFLWNNWANADPGWTGVIPATNNVMKIKKIVMDYNDHQKETPY